MGLKVEVNTVGGLKARGDSADDQTGSVGGIATDKDILGILGMLGFQEPHSQQDQLGLDNLELTGFHHQRTTTFGIGFPVDRLNADARNLSVLTEELERVDVPATGTTFLMRRSGLEDDWPVRPRSVGVVTHWRLWHDLNLRHTLTTLTMGCTNTVAASVTTTDDEHILSFSCDTLSLGKFHTCEDTILL